ncbi:MAG: class I SAM-dependent methyltransferase, partial [Candidatus Hydrogenedentales bacterium]
MAALRELYQDSLLIDVTRYFHGVSQLAIAKCQDCDLRFFVPAVAGDGDFYARLRERDWYYIKEKQEFSVSAAEISCADDVLDIGCGDGNFFNHIKPRSYLGLELSSSAAREAKS